MHVVQPPPRAADFPAASARRAPARIRTNASGPRPPLLDKPGGRQISFTMGAIVKVTLGSVLQEITHLGPLLHRHPVTAGRRQQGSRTFRRERHPLWPLTTKPQRLVTFAVQPNLRQRSAGHPNTRTHQTLRHRQLILADTLDTTAKETTSHLIPPTAKTTTSHLDHPRRRRTRRRRPRT